MDSYTMQDFSIGSDSDSDPLIEIHVVGMEICPWNRDLSLKWAIWESGSRSKSESKKTYSV